MVVRFCANCGGKFVPEKKFGRKQIYCRNVECVRERKAALSEKYYYEKKRLYARMKREKLINLGGKNV